MSLLRHAIRDVLRPVVKSTAGVSVRYFSKADGNTYPLDGSTITATLDAAEADSETNEGIQFTEMIKDFKIDVADLPVFPNDGDVIVVVEGLGIADQYYQVLRDGGNRSAEPLGNFEDTWRIHTKNIPNPATEVVQALYGNAAGVAHGNADPTGISYGSSRR